MTTVTLRKAANLSKVLLLTSKQVRLSRTVDISIYKADGFETVVSDATKALATNVADVLALVDAGFALRKLIGAANEQEINGLLTEKANLDAKEKLLTPLLAHAGVTADLIPGKLAALKARYEAHGYGEEDLTVSVPAPDDLIDTIYAIRQRKTAIDEALLGLNTNTKVTLPEDIEALLLRFKLI